MAARLGLGFLLWTGRGESLPARDVFPDTRFAYMTGKPYLCRGIGNAAAMTEILKYTLPALIVLLATWIVMHKLYKNEEQKRLWELKKLSQKEISPLRMRAYERLALLLERTTPEHLLMDRNLTETSPMQLQQQLLYTIRQEYDHNLSQQIYVSDEAWQYIVNAKEQMSVFVTRIAQQLPAGSSTIDYAKALITAYTANGETATDKALEYLKEEARGLL